MTGELVVILGIVLAIAAGGYFLSETSGKNVLTAAQIASYAQAAGFDGDDLVTATAIALAESSGDANARGDRMPVYPQGTSYGLWQIHWTVHPEVGAPENLFDPQTNANAAFRIFQEQGFNAWSTYGNQPGHNNAYAKYVSDAQGAIAV